LCHGFTTTDCKGGGVVSVMVVENTILTGKQENVLTNNQPQHSSIEYIQQFVLIVIQDSLVVVKILDDCFLYAGM
jgi:hypothetical protein